VSLVAHNISVEVHPSDEFQVLGTERTGDDRPWTTMDPTRDDETENPDPRPARPRSSSTASPPGLATVFSILEPGAAALRRF
jgi:hypothetical protein